MSVQQVGSPLALRFGPFELNVAERSLKKANQVIPLGGRAYDILIALLERAGEVVPKADLIAKAWPDVNVEEGSLRVHLSALRKALGDGQFGNKYIANLQGHGYSFIAPVARLPADHDRGSASAGMSSLPPALGRMVGRNNVVLEILGLLRAEQRLITILGAGGIGKTTVALSVGHRALADFSGAAFFVDLSTVNDEAHLIGAMASAVGLVSQLADPKEALLNFCALAGSLSFSIVVSILSRKPRRSPTISFEMLPTSTYLRPAGRHCTSPAKVYFVFVHWIARQSSRG